jgi:hypothetical protein
VFHDKGSDGPSCHVVLAFGQRCYAKANTGGGWAHRPEPRDLCFGEEKGRMGEYGAGCAVSELGLLVSQCPQNSWKPHPSTCRSIANRTSDSLRMRFPLLSQREMLPRLGWRTLTSTAASLLCSSRIREMGERVGTETTAFSENICAACSAPPDHVLALSFGGTLPNNRSPRPGPRLLVVTSALTMPAREGFSSPSSTWWCGASLQF